MPDRLLKDRTRKPPYVRPYQIAMDRLQDREIRTREDILQQARALISEERPGSEVVHEAFAYGPTGLISTHTHYFPGFAILLSLPLGMGIVAAPASSGDIRFEGGDRSWHRTDVDGNAPAWVRVVDATLRAFGCPADETSFAIASTVYPYCRDAYMAALAVAASDVAMQVSGVHVGEHARIDRLRKIVETDTGLPFGPANLIASIHAEEGRYLLVDTQTFEHLPVLIDGEEDIGWGLALVECPPPATPDEYAQRRESADEAVVLLRQIFPRLSSLRELEHRDLDRALNALPERLRSTVRHLVTENRRVQKVVAALRRKDWQLLGALLLMSHASHRMDWQDTTLQTDYIVSQVEESTIDGMFGGCTSSRGGCAVVCGHPFSVPQFLDQLGTRFGKAFGTPFESFLI